MAMDRAELEGLDRETLVARATDAGVRRARILTRPELIDELLRADPRADARALEKNRGFFGRARDLVARVVERGLHLPDAADRIRTMGTLPPSVPRTEPQAMPTVTLAEIYAAQGHPRRAIETLRRVLENEPDHAPARALLARLEDAAYVAPPPPLPPEPEVEPEPWPEEAEAEAEAEADAIAEAEADAVADAKAEAVADAEADAEAEAAENGRSQAPAFARSANAPRAEGAGRGGGSRAERVRGAVGPHEEAIGPHEEETVEIAAMAACVAIPMGHGRTYVMWSVPESLAGSSEVVLRALVVTPSWDGPTSTTLDRPVEAREGELFLEGSPEPSIVRVAVGVAGDEGFVPLAHSPAIEATHLGLVVWSTEGVTPIAASASRSASIARAVDAARRTAQV